MPSGVRDIQLLELKDTISQLNNTISTQNELIRSLQKMLQERDAKDSEKDQLIANLQAQLDYLKTRLFGSTSEIRHEQLPGQLDLFHLQTVEEPEPVPLEVEYIEVKAHKKARKSKAAYDEVFADLPTEKVYVDTLTEEQKTCDVCGTMMVPIGHELIRTELRYTEPKLERIDYYATIYECPQCKETEDPRFIKDEGTPALIPGSYASSGLARLEKLHLPFPVASIFFPISSLCSKSATRAPFDAAAAAAISPDAPAPIIITSYIFFPLTDLF